MNINLQDLRPLVIAVPIEPQEQHVIAQVYERHAETIRSEENLLRKMRIVKSGLMSDLLTGRVRVPEHFNIENRVAS